MRNLLYAITSVVILGTSCTKNDGLTDAERRAVGQYKFEKVTKQKGFLSNENLTQEYNNMILQLNDKKEAALIDQNNSITYFGKYDVVTETTTGTDDEGNDNSSYNYTIIIDIKNTGRGASVYYWHGQNASIGKRKIRFTAERAEGRYAFVLDKI